METELIAHLFRTEYRKIVSVLCKRFGLSQIEVAEDIAGETFLRAAETWMFRGVPANPAAWLYRAARNAAVNRLRRDAVFATRVVPGAAAAGASGGAGLDAFDLDLSPANVLDSQLQTMFAICHPSLPPEAQVGLALRILCGFGIDEIASAFLTNRETINKRLYRARERLRHDGVVIGPPRLEALDAVLRTIYLLFNEGYYSTVEDEVLRRDLCLEAMRLCNMLAEYPPCAVPPVFALLSLMCFHAARFDARVDADGAMVLLAEQDTSLWNAELIARGADFMRRSAAGSVISVYHLQAGIAFWHTQPGDHWEDILSLYNQLLVLEYSPVAALNRTYALARARGARAAIPEALKLGLGGSRFYWALLGELHAGVDAVAARAYFGRALEMARTAAERVLLQRKRAALPADAAP
jgi:RNA polymerase sigma factor (sigma-70 family)